MHCLSIVFNAGSPVMWKLLYREATDAVKNYEALLHTDGDVELSDDFGQKIMVSRDQLSGVMQEDLDQSKLAHIEMSLHEAKTRAAANKQAQSDPALRTSAMMGAGGMPILSPMGNGRMG